MGMCVDDDRGCVTTQIAVDAFFMCHCILWVVSICSHHEIVFVFVSSLSGVAAATSDM